MILNTSINKTKKRCYGVIKVKQLNNTYKVHYNITSDGEWKQWGAPNEVLYYTVRTIEKIRNEYLEEKIGY